MSSTKLFLCINQSITIREFTQEKVLLIICIMDTFVGCKFAIQYFLKWETLLNCDGNGIDTSNSILCI